MPLGKYLTEQEQGRIAQMQCDGQSIEAIANAPNRSKVVWIFINALQNYGKAKESEDRRNFQLLVDITF